MIDLMTSPNFIMAVPMLAVAIINLMPDDVDLMGSVLTLVVAGIVSLSGYAMTDWSLMAVIATSAAANGLLMAAFYKFGDE